MIWIC